MIAVAGDWAELTEANPYGPPHPLLIRLSAIRTVRPEPEAYLDGAVIELGTAAAPVHVTETYAELRDWQPLIATPEH